MSPGIRVDVEIDTGFKTGRQLSQEAKLWLGEAVPTSRWALGMASG